jgi:hypothetical protein
MGLAEPPASAAPAASPALAAGMDLSQLNLRVTEARAVDGIQMDGTDVKPEKGAKLVVVTLRGKLPEPGRVTVSAAAFSVLYSLATEKPGGGRDEKVAKAQAQAVDLGEDGAWASSTTATYPKPKDVLIDVALPLPAGVNDFYLLYDTAKGKQRARVKLSPTP